MDELHCGHDIFFQMPLSLIMNHGENNLNTRVTEGVETIWKPIDSLHNLAIYYVTNFIMRTINNLAKKSTGAVSQALKSIKENETSPKNEANNSNIPTQLT